MELEKAEEQLDQISFVTLTPKKGPICSSLEPVLKSVRITPQAWYGGSMCGNHSNKYFRDDVYALLTDEIVKQTRRLTNCPFIIDKAYTVKLTFDNLNSSFKEVHTLISHTKPISMDALPNIQASIDTYMGLYRRMFPNKCIPKQHILEHHCVPFIKRSGFGLGLLGEQGTEASHQSIAKIERERANGITDPIKKLQFIMETHIIDTSPSLRRKNRHRRSESVTRDSAQE